MRLHRLPLARTLALALAVGALATGCAQDTQPAPAVQTATSSQDARPEAHAHVEGHDADHAHAAAEALGVDFAVPEDHVRWEPDAPLVEGMSRIRTALAGLEHAGPRQHPDETAVAARASDIDAAIEYMFANCSLDTEPDIALHAILARLMAGTQALHADPADTTPVADMEATIDNYEQLFNDPASDAVS